MLRQLKVFVQWLTFRRHKQVAHGGAITLQESDYVTAGMQNGRVQFSGASFLIDSCRVVETVHPHIGNHQSISTGSVVRRKLDGLTALTDRFLKLPDKPVIGVKSEVRNVIPRIGSRPFH